MFGFQPLHLVVVLVIALVIFGPQRLPEIGRIIGKAVVEFRNGAREISEGFRDEMGASPAPQPPYPAAGTLRAGVTAPAGNFFIQCGAPNPIDANFCNRCGIALPGKTPEPHAPAESQDSPAA